MSGGSRPCHEGQGDFGDDEGMKVSKLLLGGLAGLVLETGGVLSHGASLCREYGLPCVTAVDAATSRINDGDLIALNGSGGLVEILERTSA